MGEYAVLDSDGNIVNIIVADQEFIDSLQSQIEDDSINTGDLELPTKPIRIDELEEKPAIGWKKNGKNWDAPPKPEPVETLDLVDEVLDDPALSGLSNAEKAAVRKAIADARGRGAH